MSAAAGSRADKMGVGSFIPRVVTFLMHTFRRMNCRWSGTAITSWVLVGTCCLAMFLCPAAGVAGEAQLKNGMIVSGNMWLLDKLAGRKVGKTQLLAIKDADPVPRNIVLIESGWQKICVPRQQIPDNQIDNQVQLKPLAFTFKHQRVNPQINLAQSGSISYMEPFDEHGRRRFTFETSRGAQEVFQGITQIEPDHIVIEGLNCHWKSGMSLKGLPIETLDALLRKQVKADDPGARLGLVGFYRQAEYFKEAFQELDAIAKAFPDQQGRCDIARTVLVDQFGREVLRELGRRRAAGQHQLAEKYIQTLSRQQLGGAVAEDVRVFVASYDQARQSIEKVKGLLIDWQAKVKNAELVARLQPLRSEINEQLGVETLPRLDAFLKAEGDTQFTPEQHLALAYSGWVVGPANAVTDLDQAVRFCDARFTMLEYLRADNVQECERLCQQLGRVEGVGPKVVLQLARQLPPALDADGIEPGELHRVLVTPEGRVPEVAYTVLLPPEYSPHHNYPLLISLRSRGRTNDELLRWWGGQLDKPGPSLKRGYIVIAPEYTDEQQAEYTYSATAHQIVIDSLRDARRRFSVDADRVFLSGHGMGADAAFDLGMSHPDEFAGVIPIGGNCLHYPKAVYENGRHTAWYVIGRGFDGGDQRDATNDFVFDNIFKRGAQFDFMLVEYLGRGIDGYVEEIPKLFDWMDLHRRPAIPTGIKVETIRKTDNRFFWVTALDLPRTTILPLPPGVGQKINEMSIEAHVKANNSVSIKSPAKKFVVRFLPDVIDLNSRVVVTINGGREFNGFVSPDSIAILEELRTTGDRSRLPLATMTFGM